MRIFFTLTLCLILTVSAFGQYFDTGQDAASIKWSQINTQGFRIVFPRENEKEAQRIANLIQKTKVYIAQPLSVSPKKINVLLHTQSTYPNALVAWAPKRMEFYTFNSPISYSEPWFKQLVLHEFRHVSQIEKINSGLTHVLSWGFGQQAVSLIQGLYVPQWFMEGDAVNSETILSSTGRGRDAYFTSKLKAQLNEKGIYSYAKANFGSYRDYVPDSYELGYHLVGWGRSKYGDALWTKTLETVSNFPFMIVPFSYGLHKVSGMGKSKFYRAALKDIQKKANSNFVLSEKKRITPAKKRNYSYYKCGGTLNDTLLVVCNRSLDDIDRIISISPSNKITKIHTLGYTYFEGISAQNGKICWAERFFSARWDNKSWSVLKIYDTKIGKTKQISRKTKYHSPALSHKADMVACVDENTEIGGQSIKVISTENGNLIHELTFNRDVELYSPSWSTDDKKIVFVRLDNSGKLICIWNPEDNSLFTIGKSDFIDKANPVFYENYILYASTLNEVGNIYALDTKNGDEFQITHAKYSATNPYIDLKNNALIYSDLTSDGLLLSSIDLNKLQWEKTDPFNKKTLLIYPTLGSFPGINADTIQSKDSVFQVKKYSKFGHLLNVHSWAPGLNIDIGNQTLKPGATLFSQNLLSTSFVTLGYTFANVENTGVYSFKYTYSGWAPKIDAQLDYTQQKGYYPYDTLQPNYTYSYLNFKIGTHMNWQWTHGPYSFGCIPRIQTAYQSFSKGEHTPNGFPYGSIQTMEYRILLFNQKKSGYRDLAPRFAQQLEVNYKNTPFHGFHAGYIFSVEVNTYFPSPAKHHSLNVYYAYQQRQASDFRFGSVIPYPRGGYNETYNAKASLLSANYLMPISYPDFNLGTWYYLKRIQAKLYCDFVQNHYPAYSTQYKTMGIEVSGDMHILGIIAPINLGLRYGWDFTHAASYYQLLWAINFNQLY